LDNGYSETRLFYRAPVNGTNRILEQVFNIQEKIIYSFLLQQKIYKVTADLPITVYLLFRKFSKQASIAVAFRTSTKVIPPVQGHNEVRWRLGQEARLAPPWSKLRSFASKCTVLKKVLVILLGLFGDPAAIRRPPQ